MRICALLALSILVSSAPAVAAAPRTSLPDVEDEVMCTVCGTPLNQSASPQADRQRAFIRRLIAQGRTKADIKDALKAEYGPAVLAMPEDDGFSLAAYLVPSGLVLGGVAGLLFALPRWRRRQRATAIADPAPALDSADARRLDEDLARYDP